MRIGYDNYQKHGTFFTEEEDPSNPLGVVACFRNEAVAGKRGEEARYVQAHVIYRDSKGIETGDAPWACWLEEDTDTVDFPVAATHCAILFLIKRDNGQIFVPWKKRKHSSAGANEIETRSFEISSDIAVLSFLVFCIKYFGYLFSIGNFHKA
jgi:hypothetical protein